MFFILSIIFVKASSFDALEFNLLEFTYPNLIMGLQAHKHI